VEGTGGGGPGEEEPAWDACVKGDPSGKPSGSGVGAGPGRKLALASCFTFVELSQDHYKKRSVLFLPPLSLPATTLSNFPVMNTSLASAPRKRETSMTLVTLMSLVCTCAPTTKRGSTTRAFLLLREEGGVDRGVAAKPAGAGGVENGAAAAPVSKDGGVRRRGEAAAILAFLFLTMKSSRGSVT